jgi:hypothetical protein
MIQVAQLNVPSAEEGCQGGRDLGKQAVTRQCPVDGARGVRTVHRACSTGLRLLARRGYLSQASTLSRLASTHFLAAASGVILSTAMYLATTFWSSFVQLKFFTRS